MSLVPYDPFRQLSNMRREFDRFFSELPISFDNEHGIGGIRVVATCDLPGLEKKEDVDIDIQNNRLSISGSIKRTNEIKEENMLKKERYTGRFQRMITLPSPVSHDGVKATYKNGILEITMPKVAKDVKKKIDVSFQ
ncbi:Hsp20/alpha crystallin family protein [Bacillus subtilis]|uniref:Hsp20/alpha crystallin family protein n=1 Tax=Bacillus subtilis TaxID=1423 RepID=UPI002D790E02|nr:Hsp20/alpha crystallin family protein [Bacillus subtilis]WRU08172.1 Hsp20/alpha crystallin family protein [Bacillus subtilis]